MLNRVYNIISKREFLRKKFLGFSIWLHNYSYRLIKKFLVKPGEIHPKHRIMKQADFFLKNISRGDMVLDIGCGGGELATALALKADKVVAIDIQEKNINKAKARVKSDNLDFIVGDATQYDFSQLGVGKFDKIILSNVLEHIDERVDFLKKIHKLSDTILLRVPMLTRDWLTVYKKENGYEYRLDPTHFTEYTESALQQELKEGGWEINNYSIQFGEFWGVIKNNI